ncbi:MAG: EFR1 family ferrodoxin [Coriobacteriales bacterium]|jgi:ferredoxin|nr:EFR1 family ferrodoxin [Coriobacteriales bacterium]
MEQFAIRYFSGTGNTEYATKRFAQALGLAASDLASIEESDELPAASEAQTLIIAYPNYMCCIPKIMKDYLLEHQSDFEGRRLFTLITYANFFFDCDLLVFRLLRKQGINFTAAGSLAIQMPMNVCDMRFMKQMPDEEIARRFDCADLRLAERAQALSEGKSLFDGKESERLRAFLRQRMFYGRRMGSYYDGLKIGATCIGCGLCAARCPLKNLEVKDGKATQKGRCVQCYRCANLCPASAITIMGKSVQWRYNASKQTRDRGSLGK